MQLIELSENINKIETQSKNTLNELKELNYQEVYIMLLTGSYSRSAIIDGKAS